MGIRSLKNFPISRQSLIANFINGKGSGWSAKQVGGRDIFNYGTISATGGTKVTSGGKSAHIFTSTGPFAITGISTGANAVEIEYFIVAGGGGGGFGVGGGGGGGGIREGTLTISIPPSASFPQAYTFTVGGGGPINPSATGSNGTPSTAFGLTADGGGGGGAGNATGVPGGSGGGSGYGIIAPQRASGNTPPTSPPQGANGGVQGPGAPTSAGGGGGGGPLGVQGGDSVAGPPKISGDGGNGTPITWAQIPVSYGEAGPNPGRYFAGGGGGGGTPQYSTTRGVGGVGGGGDGGSTSDSQAGTTNTGGGGGGGGNQPGLSFDGSAGGSGIIMIRYTPS